MYRATEARVDEAHSGHRPGAASVESELKTDADYIMQLAQRRSGSTSSSSGHSIVQRFKDDHVIEKATQQKGSLSGTSSNPAKPVPSHDDKASVEKPVDLKSKEPNAEGGDGDEHEDDRSAPADAIEDPTNQHSKPGSSKAVLDPRVAHDRDVIREQNAKILEWRSVLSLLVSSVV